MNPLTETSSDLRQFSHEDLVRMGEESLRQRLLEQAILAHSKHGPISMASLPALLADPECVRYPTRLVYEFGEMAMHQFAQPDLDHRNTETDGRVLYLRPLLRERPDLVVLAVAYILPVINYGDVISDEHCLMYGATLLGLMQDEFYQQICAMADFLEAEVRFPDATAGHGEACGKSAARPQP